MRIEDFLSRLERVRKQGNGWIGCCPAHEDKTPSLSVTEKNGKILLKCFAGCSTEAILSALNLKMSDLFMDAPRAHLVGAKIEYQYTDEGGQHIFSVFRQQRSDGSKAIWNFPAPGYNEDDKVKFMRRYIYRLPQILSAIRDDGRVYVVEGEKCADAMWKIELPATTNPCGAGKWTDEHSIWFKYTVPAEVIVIPDNDAPGRKHALQVANSLYKVGARVKLMELPGLKEKEDVYDWIKNHAG